MQAPCFWSLKTNNESSYLIGRQETIKKIQQSKNGIISSCKILDCENWTPFINQSFIHALYADLKIINQYTCAHFLIYSQWNC